MATQKPAYQIKATVTGKSWMSKGTTLTADSETEAISKAKGILSLTDEHQITVTPVTVYSSSTKLSTDSYPYGRLKTTAHFSVESNKKGFRQIFQTINPKTGRINNPKNGNYYAIMLPMQKDNGHIDFCGHTDMNGGEEINRACNFMADFFELFTPEEIERISLQLIVMLKVHTKALCIYAGIEFENLKPFIESVVKTAVNIANTKQNLFLSCILDNEKIESLKVPGFNPFVVKQVAIG